MEPNPSTLRIVEIGRPYVKHAVPQTRCFASISTACVPNTAFEPLRKLYGALRDPELDLVVCHPQYYAPWSLRWWLRHVGHRNFLKGYVPATSLVAPHWLRLGCPKPMVVIDLEDTRFIRRCDLFLLDRCKAWFKRELPSDRWQVFAGTDHPSVPTLRYRLKAEHRRRVDKLHPIPLGVRLGGEEVYPSTPLPKTSDVFWAGLSEGSSSIRERGLIQLQKLSKKGYQIDIADQPIPRAEFLRRAASAWLVWSPEGYGWDCFRHYEAPLCWSVPVMNHATIERWQPLVADRHAFYYDASGDDLTQVIVNALHDRVRLVAMASEAHNHVMKHHRLEPIVEYVTRILRMKSSANQWSI